MPHAFAACDWLRPIFFRIALSFWAMSTVLPFPADYAYDDLSAAYDVAFHWVYVYAVD